MSQTDATLERLKEKAAAEASDESQTEDELIAELDEKEDREIEEEEDSKPQAIREYVVLRKWEEAARVNAGSAEAALKILGKDDGDYAVVPSRNFSKFSIKTETKTVTHVTPA